MAAEKARALLDVLRTLSAALFRLADRHHLGDELGIQLGLLAWQLRIESRLPFSRVSCLSIAFPQSDLASLLWFLASSLVGFFVWPLMNLGSARICPHRFSRAHSLSFLSQQPRSRRSVGPVDNIIIVWMVLVWSHRLQFCRVQSTVVRTRGDLGGRRLLSRCAPILGKQTMHMG